MTHRAVDNAAGVPPGTTSNHFNSRSSLLEAALEMHLELDTPPEELLAHITGLQLSDDEALELMMANMDRLLDNENLTMLKARYELALESTRSKELHRNFGPARQRFVALAEALLTARGCESSDAHAAQLAVVMDGVLMDSLVGAGSALDRDQLSELLARQLESC